MSSTSKDAGTMTYDEYVDFLYISLEEIESATDTFADKNLLTQGSSFKVYKGKLLLGSQGLVDIVARTTSQSNLLINEVSITRFLDHKNIVSVCKIGENQHVGIIISKYEASGSLDKHLNDPNLTWMRRLHIFVRIAHALKYLHYDAQDNHHIIHGNLKTSKVLLDQNWEPKLHGFGMAVKVKKHHLHVTGKYNGSLHHMDPTYEKTKGLTHKSDIFSFGVLLFEVLFGREAFVQENDNWYFARLARSHYEEGKLDDLIDPDLRKQINLESLNMFTETAYSCLEEKPLQRPDTIKLVSRLEKALELQEHPTTQGATSSNYLKEKSLDHLRFQLSDIKLATDEFSETYCIGSGGYGNVYKAQLNLDAINLSLAIEGKNKRKLHEKRSTVAIKRIISKNVEQGTKGFIAEIELLSKCKHPNIVSLHGFCDEGEEMILVYDYVANGSLADYLENIQSKTNISWAQRIQICLDIAHGLKYLHTNTEDKQTIIHRDIKSDNILLDDNLVAKIADFGLSKLHHANQQHSTAVTKYIAGTNLYMDPEYKNSGKLKTKSDVYSFGVVMFEIMCGKLAHDITFGEEGLPSIARRCFNDGTMKSLIDKEMIDTDDEVFMLIGRVDQDSLETFTKVANDCLAESQSQRPTMELIIKELEKSLNFQKTNKENLRISLKAIQHGTQNFNDCNCIGEGRFWKLYEGQVEQANKCTTIIAKRWDTKSGQGHIQLLREVGNLSSYKNKHKNIIGLVGYCNEENENIVVYEHAFNGRLDKHLDDPCLTWTKRLKICINVAEGLEWLHKKSVEHEDSIKHTDIKSSSILLDGDWNAKISNFEMSCHAQIYERAEHVDDNSNSSFGYVDPEYQLRGFLTHKSDIYSLGVILVELLTGSLAWEEGCVDHDQSLGPLAKKQYKEKGKLDEMIFEGIKEEIVLQSLTTFQWIALKCLEDDSNDRPSIEDVVIQLKKALKFQENFHISLKAIKLGTQDFSDCNCIGDGKLWKLYEGEIEHTNGCTSIVVKRWDKKYTQRHIEFSTEHDVLLRYKHENIIGLVNYCKEENEHIIVYEHVSNGILNKHLDNPGYTWMKRLQTCIGIANGLRCLHSGHQDRKEGRIHRDIKSGSILLDDDWNAKISNLGVSCEDETYLTARHVDDNGCGSLGYVDPSYQESGYLEKYSDIYSLGVILIEMLCGRLAWAETWEEYTQSLGCLAKTKYREKGNIDEMIFEDIKGQIAPKSLPIFLEIANKCLDDEVYNRPNADDVAIQLMNALKFQEDYEKWELKLPKDYKEIIQTSKTPEIYNSIEMKKDLYDMFTNGILLQDDKTMFSLGRNGKGNYEMVSATKFSYRGNHRTHKCRSLQESRFHKATEMCDISNLKIRIKITTQFLSVGVNYGAYLVFKFCDARKFSSKPMYVNLKYKKGDENLHAYFATWRDDKWMMIELFRFLSHKKDITFEVLLESFSRYYCGKSSIYVEGIEFRVIDKMNDEEIKNDQQILKSNSSSEIKQVDKLLLWSNEVNGKKHVMLSAMEVLYDSSNVIHFHLNPSSESRFPEVIELLPQEVFHIKCKIQSQMLSPDTKYLCYLIFNLSEKCHGLHCPVKVRDLLHRNNKEAEIIYFRSPSPWNLHEYIVPEQRKDGWMEVNVWKFNPEHQLKDDCIRVNLKLITYEGTMSGLIVCGMEFRPM